MTFQLRYAWFNFREQYSDIKASLATNALIPFFVWILSRVWSRFNAAHSTMNLSEVVIYIGLGEILFMTFVRPAAISRASGDFSISLARPRSWLMTSFFGLIGRSFGQRLFMLAMLIVCFPILGASFDDTIHAALRFLLLLPWLTVLQGLIALFFSIAQVMWHQTNYFLLPIGKLWLVLGGVWGPLCDFSEPWRSALIAFFPADLFFQPAYFMAKGVFFETTPLRWFLHTVVIALVMIAVNISFFRFARRQHQSFGG